MDLRTLWNLQYGMYIVSSKISSSQFNGQIANTVFQVTAEPPTIGVSINKQNYTHEFIEESGVFTVSILTELAPMPFMGTFGFKSGRDIDKFKDVKYKIGKTGAPIVTDYSNGFIECEVFESVDCGTHTLFIGNVIDTQLIENEGKPMSYAFYHTVKNGKIPKTATHYIAKDKVDNDKNPPKKEEVKMAKYECEVCGYIYDPDVGDPDTGINAGTSFEDLPEDWVCPVCGVGKDQFTKV